MQLSGLVVASRLSEDPSISVLVIEAGHADLDDPSILSPAAITTHLGKDKYDWNFSTIPQDGLNGRALPWPRGKGLGGSSAINYLQFHLPAKSDIDAWEVLGNPGWNWERLKPYYKKVEGFVPPASKPDAVSFDVSQHGLDGPLTVAYPKTLSGLEIPYQEVCYYLKFLHLTEFVIQTLGTWLSPVCVDPETRVRTYSANAYYAPNAARPNLSVLSSAQVVKIEFSSMRDVTTMIATGVTFVIGNEFFTVQASQEVVIAAGAVGSPQILELSGIGDRTVLDQAGVKVKHHLPGVGTNLQEHVMLAMSFEMANDPDDKYVTLDCLRDPVQRQKQLGLLQATGTGAFSMSPTCKTFAPLSAISSSYDALQGKLKASITNRKHTQAVQKQYAVFLDHIAKKEPSCELSLVPGALRSPKAQPQPGKKYLTMNSFLNHAFSRGTIHIVSSNFQEPPAIDPHYFEEEYDLMSLVECVKFNRRLVQQEPLRSILSGVELFPGLEYDTDDKLAGYVKEYATTTFHPAGSCAMLPLDDGGVVDTKLKVYGTKNVRVVDASIIPLQIGAHIQATVYAIAELGASALADGYPKMTDVVVSGGHNQRKIQKLKDIFSDLMLLAVLSPVCLAQRD
ncbi:alcohol oxidase [Vararia minispora EC-137]|uniref:Alcohol oxidase n=1 Tax=Vararia minispora EC-137 TaxID=1314806 RepID=A0ACB8QN14_9AGAM|nr:alcohol oxidase [Vararia minispora EC-137]